MASHQPGGRILRDVLLAFVRVHLLHHARETPIFGVEMMDELRRHGYRIGPGTLYPLLHAMEAAGALAAHDAVVDGKVRRYYRATKSGERLLKELQARLRELVDEVVAPPRGDIAPTRVRARTKKNNGPRRREPLSGG